MPATAARRGRTLSAVPAPLQRRYHAALALVSGPPADATSAATQLEHEGRSDGEDPGRCGITLAARTAPMNAAPAGSDQGAPGRGRVVAVFGGTGFLGRRVVRRLLGHGFRVRAISRHHERAPSLLGPDGAGAEAVGADVHDEASVASALAGASGAVNAVGLYA